MVLRTYNVFLKPIFLSFGKGFMRNDPIFEGKKWELSMGKLRTASTETNH